MTPQIPYPFDAASKRQDLTDLRRSRTNSPSRSRTKDEGKVGDEDNGGGSRLVERDPQATPSDKLSGHQQLRCDCGPQLRAALDCLAAAEWGLLVYVCGHEGRGIGRVDKMRAHDTTSRFLKQLRRSEQRPAVEEEAAEQSVN